MTPDEWQQGIQNEAEHVDDAAWAAEARRLALAQRWKANLHSFLIGLLIVEGSVLLLLWRALFFQAHPQADPNFWTWWGLNVWLSALILAFVAGCSGQRAWPLALAFGAAPPLATLSAWLCRIATQDGGLTFSLSGWWWWLGFQVGLAYLAVAFGRRFFRPRRAV